MGNVPIMMQELTIQGKFYWKKKNESVARKV
jgi:hypothetical protein